MALLEINLWNLKIMTYKIKDFGRKLSKAKFGK